MYTKGDNWDSEKAMVVDFSIRLEWKGGEKGKMLQKGDQGVSIRGRKRRKRRKGRNQGRVNSRRNEKEI